MLLNWYSSMKKMRKILIINDLENWPWKSNFGNFWHHTNSQNFVWLWLIYNLFTTSDSPNIRIPILQIFVFVIEGGQENIFLLVENIWRVRCREQVIGVFNFLQETNQNQSTWGIIVVKSNLLVHFLEEIDDPKNHFEINWPF